jgi:rod shape-determining protein MreC
VLVALSAVLMVMDHKYKSLESVRDALSVLVYPIQLSIEIPGSISDWFSESLATRRKLQEEIDSLRTQHFVQKAQMQKLAALEVENIRLRELLDSSFEVGEKVLIAELMSVNLDPYKHQVVINKGELHDVYPGQPLVDADGVMGQIVHAGPYSSTAILITDTSHAIPIQVNRNGLRSIALGSGAINRLELPYVPNSADIQAGDLLTTSGLGGRFPPGYPVATVATVEHDPGNAFAKVIATPLAHLNRSREVLLVWPSPATSVESTDNIPVEALIEEPVEEPVEEPAEPPEVTAGPARETGGNSDAVTNSQADAP